MLFQQVGGSVRENIPEFGTEFSPKGGATKENEFLNPERPKLLKNISPFDYQ